MGQTTSVDVLSLGDFRETLRHRHAEVCTMLDRLQQVGRVPQLGGFPDAVQVGNRYVGVVGQHRERLVQLKAAIEAAYRGTTTIMANYATAEQRSGASPAAVSDQLAGVRAVLAVPPTVEA
jgi:hypothetical protein